MKPASPPITCSYLWNNICIGSGGELTPCCRYKHDEKEAFPLYNQGLISAFNQTTFSELRRQTNLGTWPKGCTSCQDFENQGIESLRQLRARYFPFDPSVGDRQVTNNDILSIEIFTGDQCNLGCLMCQPELSSWLQHEHQTQGWSWNKQRKIKDYDFLSQQLRDFTSLRMIKFAGGESLLGKNHVSILKGLNPKYRGQITLIYNTNGTIFPDSSIWELWRDFKAVYLRLSIDGVGAVNEYIRYPSSWQDIEHNLSQFIDKSLQDSRFKIGFITTVSILNIFNLKHIEEWSKNVCQSLGYWDHRFRLLDRPKMLNFNVLNGIQRELAIEALNPQSHFQSQLKKDLTEKPPWPGFEQTKEYLRNKDQARKVKYEHVIPELA
jgi:uncharacterized Fe-S cluster-containing radical SAM superfamily protein